MVYGELCVVPCSIELDVHLPIEVVAVKMISQDISSAIGWNGTSLELRWRAVTETDGISETSGVLGSIELSPGEETEFIGEYDIASTLTWGDSHISSFMFTKV